jgi:hypothetical protein
LARLQNTGENREKGKIKERIDLPYERLEMNINGSACVAVTSHHTSRNQNNTNGRNHPLPEELFKLKTPVPLADRRIAEQFRKAANFIEDGDFSNFRTALVVAIEWGLAR